MMRARPTPQVSVLAEQLGLDLSEAGLLIQGGGHGGRAERLPWPGHPLGFRHATPPLGLHAIEWARPTDARAEREPSP